MPKCVSEANRANNFLVCKKNVIFFQATITRCDLSATILFKLVDSYFIAFKFAQQRSVNTEESGQ